MLRHIASWHEREDVAIVLPSGREIPAVQINGTGRLYVRDGHGRQHTIAWRSHNGQEWLVLDDVEGHRFSSLAEAIGHLEALGGEPIPRGRVTVIGQVGGQMVYALDEGAGE